MAKLNEKTEVTEKIIHLMVTSLCNRNCKLCCNKQYNLNLIEQVTEDELKKAEILCLTGGEPFLFTEPNIIARFYKNKYPNIKNIYVYTNAVEFAQYLEQHKDNALEFIDGVNVSIKNETDKKVFSQIAHDTRVCMTNGNRLYVFEHLVPDFLGNFKHIDRIWQKDFIPAKDSIFRRV